VLAVLLDQGLLAGLVGVVDGGGVQLPPSWPMGDAAAGLDPWYTSGIAVASVTVVLGMQAVTGWTPGKLVVGIAVVRDRDLRPAGVLRTLGRVVFHVVDALVLMLGYLRPLWQPEGRTIADSAMGTVVVLRRPTRLRRPWGRSLTAAAGALCVLGVACSASWPGFGGHARTDHRACAPGPVTSAGEAIARSSSVEVSVVQTWDEERRLWTSRTLASARSVTATWHWAEPLPADGDLALATTVSRPDGTGAATERVGLDGRSAETTTVALQSGSTAGQGAAQSAVGGERLGDLGEVLDVRTAFLVDGVEVATCAVAGLDAARPASMPPAH
jgi:Mce-associated membrane protein